MVLVVSEVFEGGCQLVTGSLSGVPYSCTVDLAGRLPAQGTSMTQLGAWGVQWVWWLSWV